jgi:hypothetical protein
MHSHFWLSENTLFWAQILSRFLYTWLSSIIVICWLLTLCQALNYIWYLYNLSKHVVYMSSLFDFSCVQNSFFFTFLTYNFNYPFLFWYNYRLTYVNKKWQRVPYSLIYTMTAPRKTYEQHHTQDNNTGEAELKPTEQRDTCPPMLLSLFLIAKVPN